jgi:hypothetical protein
MKINGTLVFEASSASEIQNLSLQKVASLPGMLPTDVGRLIYNTSNNSIYVGNNADGLLSWIQVATGGDASALVAEIDRVETALGLNSTGAFNPAAFSGNLAGQTSYVGLINTLQNLVATVTSASAAETTRATNAEAGLNTRVDNAVAATTSEVSRALSSESSLSNRISTEVNERTSTVNAVAGNLSTEVAARSLADTNLQTAINAEVTRATQQESAIRSEMASAISGLTWIAPINFMVSNHLTVTTASVGNRVLNLTNFTVYQVTAVNAGTPTYGPGKALVDGTAFFFTNNGAGYVFNGSAVVQFNGANAVTAGMGLIKTGNVLDVNSNTGTISVTADSIDIATNVLNSITANTTAITGEVSRAKTAEDGLSSRINSEQSTRMAAVTGERDRAIDAEQSLEDSIFSTAASTLARLTPAYQSTPPTDELFSGKTWINSDTGKLYYYFVNGGVASWVEYFASEVVDNSGSGDIEPNPGTGNGTGNGLTEEVILEQDETGSVYFDSALGNNFRIVTAKAIRFGNPIGYGTDAEITCTVVQGVGAPHTATFDTLFATQDQQQPVLATTEKAINLLKFHPTFDPVNGVIWITQVTPDKAFTVGYGVNTEIAMINDTGYFTLNTPVGSSALGAFAAVRSGQTVDIIRNGRGPEATGTIETAQGTTYTVRGTSYGSGTDRRPTLTLLPDTRPAYGKALLNFEGKGTVYVSDLKVQGARNIDQDARGIAHNADNVTLHVTNVKITDCNNGMLTGNQTMTGDTYMTDVHIDLCGIGGKISGGIGTTSGYTHSVYFGHNNTVIRMNRVSLTNAREGDNLKSRSGSLFASQVLCQGAQQGRELEIPNGGWIEMDNCIFWKQNQEGQGNMVMLGGNGGPLNSAEGLDTSRPRKYKFTNCLFRSDYVLSGRDGNLVCCLDPDVGVEFVDCKFEGTMVDYNGEDPNGENIYVGTMTRNGIRYKPSAPPIYTYTGGPLGPILPVGCVPTGIANVTE